MDRNWPALVLGVVVAAYWGRVLQMVRRARLRAGHAANFVPPEPLGRVLRIVWMPVVGMWVLLPLLGALVKKWPPGFGTAFLPLAIFGRAASAVAWVAAGVGVLAFVATVVCWRKMGKSWRMGIDPGDKTQLVFTGPYAYVRHPIYALSSLLMLCTVAALPSPLMIAAGVVHLALLQWEARREEKYLRALHGGVYASYAARTGRFLPKRLAAYSPEG